MKRVNQETRRGILWTCYTYFMKKSEKLKAQIPNPGSSLSGFLSGLVFSDRFEGICHFLGKDSLAAGKVCQISLALSNVLVGLTDSAHSTSYPCFRVFLAFYPHLFFFYFLSFNLLLFNYCPEWVRLTIDSASDKQQPRVSTSSRDRQRILNT